MGRSPAPSRYLDSEPRCSIRQRTTRIRDALDMRFRHVRLPDGQWQLRLLQNRPCGANSPSTGRFTHVCVATWTCHLAQRGPHIPCHHEPNARHDDPHIQPRPSSPAIPPRSRRSNNRIPRPMRKMASPSLPDANRAQQFLATSIPRFPRKRLSDGRSSARRADALRLRTRKFCRTSFNPLRLSRANMSPSFRPSSSTKPPPSTPAPQCSPAKA